MGPGKAPSSIIHRSGPSLHCFICWGPHQSLFENRPRGWSFIVNSELKMCSFFQFATQDSECFRASKTLRLSINSCPLGLAVVPQACLQSYRGDKQLLMRWLGATPSAPRRAGFFTEIDATFVSDGPWSIGFWAVRPDGVVQRAENRLKFHADLGLA